MCHHWRLFHLLHCLLNKIIRNHYWIINTEYVDIYLRHENPNPRELKRCRNVQDPDTQTRNQSNRHLHSLRSQSCLWILHPCILMRTKPQKHTSRPVSRPHYHLPHQWHSIPADVMNEIEYLYSVVQIFTCRSHCFPSKIVSVPSTTS